MYEFNDRLKELRLQKKHTQQEFGEILGVTKNTQQNYEAGKRAPDANYLMKLAQAGYDVKYLITGERDYSELTPKQIELLQLFDSASAEYRDAVFDLMMIEQAPSPASDVLNSKKALFKLLTGSDNPRQLTIEQQELLNLYAIAEPAIQEATMNILKYHREPSDRSVSAGNFIGDISNSSIRDLKQTKK